MTMRKSSEAERDLVETARRVLPAGGFGNVPHEIVIAEGRGGRVWDVSGNEYVDYLLGSGPMLVGHAHPEVVDAVQEQGSQGQHLLRQQRVRHPPRGGDRRRGAVRREGALRQHRLGGRPLRHAACPRLHAGATRS